MKFVSYYTDLYAWDAEQLLKSLARQGIQDFKVERRPQLGSWERNTQYKAPFILEKLLEGGPVVWTDADSRILQYPVLFDSMDCDVAFFYFSKDQVPEFQLPANSILSRESVDRDGYLQSGTMFFNHTPNTFELLKKWISNNEQDHVQWDQWTLQAATEQIPGLRIGKLPPEYVWIDGVSSSIFGSRKPVIEHLQASRKYKDKLRN